MNKEELKKDFVYLLNKCSMLYIYLDKSTKKDVLLNIKDFINKLHNTFNQNIELQNLNNDLKKEKILHYLIPYLNKLTTNFMIEHIIIDENKKELLIKEIDISSLSNARKLLKEDNIQNNYVEKTDNIQNNYVEKTDIKKDKVEEQINKVTHKITNHIDDKMISLYNELNKFFEMKFNVINDDLNKSNEKLKSNINLLENELNENILNKFENQKSENITHLSFISQKIYEEIEKYNGSYLENNYDKIRDEIRDKIMYDLENIMKNEISSKVERLTHILNKNLETSLKHSTQLTYDEIKEFVNKKIEEYECLIKNTPYTLVFDKYSNTIKLMNNTNILSSISLPLLKGDKGDKGDCCQVPIFKNLDVSKDGFITLIVQDENRSYELKSANKINIPTPQTVYIPQNNTLNNNNKEVKEIVNTTKIIHDLNFDKSHVMRLEDQSLIILKSLSIGENSHCIKSNSLAIGGATTFQEQSLALGSKSQTLSKNSIALFGSTSGENSFAYNAQNVPSNQFIIGNNSDNLYNIQKISLNAEYINLNSKNISIKLYDEKIKVLENKIELLEKEINMKNNNQNNINNSSGFSSIFPSSFVQDKFF